MIYAKKEADGNWSSNSEIQFPGSFPVMTSREFPIFEILVFDELQGQWVENSVLEAAYNTKKAQDDAVNLRIKKQGFGSLFMAKVIELNVAKFSAGQLTQTDRVNMDLNATLQSIERAAWRGNLTTLKGLIQSYSGSYYTADEKIALVALIDASGLV